MTEQRRRAFSLTELLIVLVIVAVLGAILFPVFNKAKEKSRRTQCLSNERQMSTAWLMYAQDNSGHVVPWSVSGHSNSPAFIWDRLIQPYQNTESTLHCPATTALVSYTYNANIGGASPSPPMRLLTSLKNPTQTPIIADCSGFTDPVNNTTGWSYSFCIPDEKGGRQARLIHYGSMSRGIPTGDKQWSHPDGNLNPEAAVINPVMHSGGANYIFADGHTKWLPAEMDNSGNPMPARKGMDYNSDGVLGDDEGAGTGGKYN